jgi:hypothetical protein
MQIYVGAIDYRYAFALDVAVACMRILHLHLYYPLMWSKRAYYEIAISAVDVKSNAIPEQRYERKSRTRGSMPGEKNCVSVVQGVSIAQVKSFSC